MNIRDEAAISAIKKVMGYRDGTECCRACKYFGESEALGGSPSARPDRCERNAFWFPVSEAGFCDIFEARPKKK